MPRPFGRDHKDVDVLRWADLPEVDVKAVGKQERVALLQVGRDLLAVDLRLHLVGQQDHHEVARASGVGDLHHLEPCTLGLGPRGAAPAQPHHHPNAGLLGV